jgi:hypothetical protein
MEISNIKLYTIQNYNSALIPVYQFDGIISKKDGILLFQNKKTLFNKSTIKYIDYDKHKYSVWNFNLTLDIGTKDVPIIIFSKINNLQKLKLKILKGEFWLQKNENFKWVFDKFFSLTKSILLILLGFLIHKILLL